MTNKKGQINPSRKFKKDLWKELDNKWNKLDLPPYSFYQTRVFRNAAVVAIFVILVSGGGTGAYAYASSSVTEGTKLYPVKQQIEKIEERLNHSPHSKAKYYLKMVERRERELQHIRKFRNNEKKTIEGLNNMNKKLEKTRIWFEKKEIKDPILKERIEKKLEHGGRLIKHKQM